MARNQNSDKCFQMAVSSSKGELRTCTGHICHAADSCPRSSPGLPARRDGTVTLVPGPSLARRQPRSKAVDREHPSRFRSTEDQNGFLESFLRLCQTGASFSRCPWQDMDGTEASCEPRSRRATHSPGIQAFRSGESSDALGGGAPTKPADG